MSILKSELKIENNTPSFNCEGKKNIRLDFLLTSVENHLMFTNYKATYSYVITEKMTILNEI